MKRDFPSLLPAQLLAQEITVTLPLADILQLYTPAVTSFEASTDAGSIPIGAEAAGQIYAGLTLHDNRPHRLFLVPGELEEGTWKQATEWAAKQGGGDCVLPSRIDSLVLFQNLKREFKDAWYWTSEPYASNAGYAWVQDFSGGTQDINRTSNPSCRARAVRRVAI